ncbi:hypothetical protein KL941_002254 [Ogataea angusta]|nr:hypothetical protein KL941_002254 [Ogataea angusta]
MRLQFSRNTPINHVDDGRKRQRRDHHAEEVHLGERTQPNQTHQAEVLPIRGLFVVESRHEHLELHVSVHAPNGVRLKPATTEQERQRRAKEGCRGDDRPASKPVDHACQQGQRRVADDRRETDCHDQREQQQLSMDPPRRPMVCHLDHLVHKDRIVPRRQHVDDNVCDGNGEKKQFLPRRELHIPVPGMGKVRLCRVPRSSKILSQIHQGLFL